MTIAVKTLEPGDVFTAAAPTAVASQALSVSDAAADPTILRTYKPASGTASSFNSPDLFPYFHSPYSFFTGDCAYMSPTKASTTYPTYFSTINANAAEQGDPPCSSPRPRPCSSRR